MFITKKHIYRRSVLRGAGASVALPLLDAMVPAATALAATAAKPTPRLGFVYFPHGAVMQHWSPAATGADFEMSKILEPAAKHSAQMTIVSGLRNRAADSRPRTPSLPAPGWASSPAVSHDPKAGTTVDQMAARAMGEDTAFPPGAVHGRRCRATGTAAFGTAFRSPTQPLPMEFNPRKVFYRLFGQGDTAEERCHRRRDRQHPRCGQADATRLQEKLGAARPRARRGYLDSVREIERRIQK